MFMYREMFVGYLKMSRIQRTVVFLPLNIRYMSYLDFPLLAFHNNKLLPKKGKFETGSIFSPLGVKETQ